MAEANEVGTEESGSVSGPPCAPRPPTTGVSDTQMDRDVDDMLRLAEEEALAEDRADAVAALGEHIEKRSGTTPPPSQGLLASWLASSVVPPEVATPTGRSLKKACFPELGQRATSTNSPLLQPAAPAGARPSSIDERRVRPRRRTKFLSPEEGNRARLTPAEWSGGDASIGPIACRARCQCACGCGRQPGRRLACRLQTATATLGCGALIGPGCCAQPRPRPVGALDGLCCQCALQLPNPQEATRFWSHPSGAPGRHGRCRGL